MILNYLDMNNFHYTIKDNIPLTQIDFILQCVVHTDGIIDTDRE